MQPKRIANRLLFAAHLNLYDNLSGVFCLGNPWAILSYMYNIALLSWEFRIAQFRIEINGQCDCVIDSTHRLDSWLAPKGYYIGAKTLKYTHVIRYVVSSPLKSSLPCGSIGRNGSQQGNFRPFHFFSRTGEDGTGLWGISTGGTGCSSGGSLEIFNYIDGWSLIISIDVSDARLVFRTFLIDSLFFSVIAANRKSNIWSIFFFNNKIIVYLGNHQNPYFNWHFNHRCVNSRIKKHQIILKSNRYLRSIHLKKKIKIK